MKYKGGNTWLAIIVIVVVVIIIGLWAARGGDTEEPDVRVEDETEMMEEEMSEEVTESEDEGGAMEESAGLPDGVYALDGARSVIGYVGRKVLVNTEHAGIFPLIEGSFVIESGSISEGRFVIDMAGFTDDGSGVGGYLKNSDFFDVAIFPEASFVVTSFDEGMITGDLTLKGTTAPVSFEATLAAEGGTLRAQASFVIDRTTWGITFGSGSFFDDLGDAVIDDSVTITLDLYATTKAGETPQVNYTQNIVR